MKLSGLSVMNAMGSILKSINVYLIDHFCVGKYCISLDIFLHTPAHWPNVLSVRETGVQSQVRSY